MARRILGLDLGSHAVKAVELRQTLRGVEVVQARHILLDDPAPALATELRDLVMMHDMPSDGVVTSLAGDRVSLRQLLLPFKDRRKIAPAVPFEVEAQVPFPLDDYVLDWEMVGQTDAGTRIAAALAPRDEVALLLEMLGEAGLRVPTVEPEGIVLGNLSEVFELPGTRLLLDIGHRKSTACLFIDGRAVTSRSIPIAGAAFTAAIARERNVGELEAERAKIETAVLAAGGSAGAQAVALDLAREVARSIGAFEPLLGGAPLDGISLLGGSAHLEHLDSYLAEQTGHPTERLPLPAGELGSAFLAAGDPLVHAPAMALALRGSSLTHSHLNLRQGDFEHRIDLRAVGRELRWTSLLAGALLLLLGIATGAGILQARQDTEATEARAVAVAQQALGGRPITGSPVAALTDAVRQAQKRADTLGVYRGNLSALDVLTELSARIPADLDVVFEELSIDRQVVQIKGHSPSFGSVDRLRQELAQYPPFSEITVGDITRDERRGGQNFSVRISLGEESS